MSGLHSSSMNMPWPVFEYIKVPDLDFKQAHPTWGRLGLKGKGDVAYLPSKCKYPILDNLTEKEVEALVKGKLVRIYFNFPRKCFSATVLGKVIGHFYTATVYDAKFTVSATGYKRALKEKRKNVHAFVVSPHVKFGCTDYEKITDEVLLQDDKRTFAFERVTYDYRKAGYFMNERGVEISFAPIVLLSATSKQDKLLITKPF